MKKKRPKMDDSLSLLFGVDNISKALEYLKVSKRFFEETKYRPKEMKAAESALKELLRVSNAEFEKVEKIEEKNS